MKFKRWGKIIVKNILNKKIIALLVVSFSFAIVLFFSHSPEQEVDYCELADRLLTKYIDALWVEEDLFVTRRGGGFMNNVQRFILSFGSYRKMTVDEARDLYVKIIENLVQLVNQDRTIRPFLDRYPFTWDNLEISFSCYGPNNRFSNEGVAYVFQGKKGTLVYDIYDGNAFQTIHKESFEEAKQLARLDN